MRDPVESQSDLNARTSGIHRDSDNGLFAADYSTRNHHGGGRRKQRRLHELREPVCRPLDRICETTMLSLSIDRISMASPI
jgi:hypothetical protein